MELSIMYCDWLNQWLERKTHFIKASTHGTYSNLIINHIIPILGNIPISSINEDHIQQAVIYWATQGKMNCNHGLSDSTVRDILSIVRLSIKDARKYFQLPAQSYDIYSPKSYRSPLPKILSQTEHKRLTTALLNDINSRNCGILLTLYTGIRIGELCALTWQDINLECQVISITKTLQRIFTKNSDGSGSSKITITPPKTASSIRDIPLPSFLLPIFKEISPSNANSYLLSGTLKYIEPRIYRLYYLSLIHI